MATIQEIYDEFTNVFSQYCRMLADSTILKQQNVSYDGHAFSDDMYGAIVEKSFMQIYLAWERFLEKAFIAYLQKASDLQGESYTTYSFPIDDEHSYKMLKGTKNYPDWTNIDEINYLSTVYFDASGPFAILLAPPPELLEIKTIRNRISHVSEKSIKSFNTLLSKRVSQTNILPGDYLMMFKSSSITYFTFYVDMLKDYVDAICNK